eukprot:4476622-Lingulodinium_polyedra.AAC.1
MEKSFLTKVVGKLGGDEGDSREVRVLNRVLSWSASGIRYEADPRHAEILVKSLVGRARPATTPGTRIEGQQCSERFAEAEAGKEEDVPRDAAAVEGRALDDYTA